MAFILQNPSNVQNGWRGTKSKIKVTGNMPYKKACDLFTSQVVTVKAYTGAAKTKTCYYSRNHHTNRSGQAEWQCPGQGLLDKGASIRKFKKSTVTNVKKKK